jgi:hypothetical protein
MPYLRLTLQTILLLAVVFLARGVLAQEAETVVQPQEQETKPAERGAFKEAIESIQQRILARPSVHGREPYDVVFKQGESFTFVLRGRNLDKIGSAMVTYRNESVRVRGVSVSIGKVTPTSIELTVSADKTAGTGSSFTVRLFTGNNAEMFMSPYYSNFSIKHWDDRPRIRALPPRTRERVIEDVEDSTRFPSVYPR